MSQIKECIKILHGKGTISGVQAEAAITEIMEGKATDGQIGSFLTSLSLDRCTPEVVAGCAVAMRAHALPCQVPGCIDIVGTGGDGIDTFNVSTAAAIVVAAAGGKVMKHGNRSNSSKCGSADLLEACGGNLWVDGPQAISTMEKSRFCFIFAQKFHPSMKHVAPVRKQLGIRTVFNILGPLTNPCVPEYNLTGVFHKSLGRLYAETFRTLGVKRGMVCHGADGLDEITPAGITHTWIVKDGNIEERDITPEDFGLKRHPLEAVAGGDPSENKLILESLVNGEESAYADYVIMNAAAALYIADMAKTLKEAATMARAAISAGKAKTVLEEYVKASNAHVKNESILTKISKHRQTLVAKSKSILPLEELYMKSLSNPPLSPIDVCERIEEEKGDCAVFAEIKRASPSKGVISFVDPAKQALRYAKGGATVISVLTEPKWFHGSIGDLRDVAVALRQCENRPAILLKDFVQDKYQLVEARVNGADLALLIVACLSDEKLTQLFECCERLGLEALVEVANEEEMKRALALPVRLIGINNRDLHTFKIDRSRTTRLIKLIPPERKEQIKVAALSGIKNRADVQGYVKDGCVAVLVGETLMRSSDPEKDIQDMRGVLQKKNKKNDVVMGAAGINVQKDQ